MADMNGKRILEDTDPAPVSSTKKSKTDHEGNSFKLVVRGLYNGTTETKLREYFSQYGEIKNIYLTDVSGLAFITFTEAQAKDKIFEVDDHFLDGRKIYPKRQRPHKYEPSLFVRDLPKDTTVSRVEEYFSTYGEIEHIDARIQKGNCTIVFTDAQTIDKVIEAGEHFLDGTSIKTKRKGFTGGKLFVGGLPNNTTESKIRDYFSVYGEIFSINLNKIKKGIGFILFTKAQSLDKILEEKHFLDGNKLITKISK